MTYAVLGYQLYANMLTPRDYDLYELASRLRAFVGGYETNRKQSTLFSAVGDELLFPILSNSHASSITVRLVCEEVGTKHTLMVDFEGLSGDPLDEPYLDELNRILLQKYSNSVRSEEKEAGRWEVVIEMS